MSVIPCKILCSWGQRFLSFEIAGGSARPLPLVKGVGTKRLGKGRVKSTIFSDCLLFLLFYIATCEFSMKIILCFRLLIFEVLDCTLKIFRGYDFGIFKYYFVWIGISGFLAQTFKPLLVCLARVLPHPLRT